MKRHKPEYRCSFCGKAQEAIRRLIAGPGGVYICNECILLCMEIIAEEQHLAGRGLIELARAVATRYPQDGEVREVIERLAGELASAQQTVERLQGAIDAAQAASPGT